MRNVGGWVRVVRVAPNPNRQMWVFTRTQTPILTLTFTHPPTTAQEESKAIDAAQQAVLQLGQEKATLRDELAAAQEEQRTLADKVGGVSGWGVAACVGGVELGWWKGVGWAVEAEVKCIMMEQRTLADNSMCTTSWTEQRVWVMVVCVPPPAPQPLQYTHPCAGVAVAADPARG